MIGEKPQILAARAIFKTKMRELLITQKYCVMGFEQQLLVSATLYYNICLLELGDHLFKLLDYT